MSTGKNFSKTKQDILVNLIYWILGGVILGLVEIWVGLPRYPWIFPHIGKFSLGPICYALLGLIGGAIWCGLCWLFNHLRRQDQFSDCFYAASNVVLIMFVWLLLWTTDVFNLQESLGKQTIIYLSYTAGVFFAAYVLGCLAHKFFNRQKSKDRLLVAFITLSCALYVFTAVAMCLNAKELSSSIALKYNLINLLGSVLLGLVIYYLIMFLTKFNSLTRISGGVVVLGGITLLMGSLYKNATPKVKTEPPVDVGAYIVNKQQVITRDRPNILLITPDTLRSDALSCNGYKQIKTSAIDSIAIKGVLFRNTVSVSPWTLPAFASLLSSTYPTVHNADKKIAKTYGISKNKMTNTYDISKNVVLLAQVLKEVGYATQAFVHNNYLGSGFGFNRGFDSFKRLKEKDDVILFEEKVNLVELKRAFLWTRIWATILKLNRTVSEDDPADATLKITDKAISWLEKNSPQPFFLWVHYFDPHDPYKQYKSYNLNPEYKGRLTNADFSGKVITDKVRSGYWQFNQADKKYLKTLYDEEVLLLDENIGRLLKKLEKLGLMDNTLIVFTSDHGEEFWDHGGFGHGHTLYRELLQVPLIIQFPKVLPQGEIIETQVRFIDVMPTILEILGIQHNIEMSGKSLLPVITGEEQGDRVAFSESVSYFEERKSIQTGRYKFIYLPHSGDSELYDLEKDPGEQENIISQQPEIATELKKQLLAWMKDCKEMAQKLNTTQESRSVELEEDAIRQLKALGYIQ